MLDKRKIFHFKSRPNVKYSFSELVSLDKSPRQEDRDLFDNYLLCEIRSNKNQNEVKYERVAFVREGIRRAHIRSIGEKNGRLNAEYHSSEGVSKTHEWAISAFVRYCNQDNLIKVKINGDKEYEIYVENSYFGHGMECYSSVYIPDLVLILDRKNKKNEEFISKYGFLLFVEFMYSHKVPASKKEEFRLQNYTLLEYKIDESIYVDNSVDESLQSIYENKMIVYFSNTTIQFAPLSIYNKNYKKLSEDAKANPQKRYLDFGNERYYINGEDKNYWIRHLKDRKQVGVYYRAFEHVTEKKDFKTLPFDTIEMAEMYINYLHNYFSKK